jgi:hypothetical protein
MYVASTHLMPNLFLIIFFSLERPAIPLAETVLPIMIPLSIPAKIQDSLIREAAQEVGDLLEISGVSSVEMKNSDGTIGLRNNVSRFINYLFWEISEIGNFV